MESKDGSTAGSHRGVPINSETVKLEELAERLRGVLVGHALLLPSVPGMIQEQLITLRTQIAAPWMLEESMRTAWLVLAPLDEEQKHYME